MIGVGGAKGLTGGAGLCESGFAAQLLEARDASGKRWGAALRCLLRQIDQIEADFNAGFDRDHLDVLAPEIRDGPQA